VSPGSAAAQAQVLEGDVVKAIDDAPIASLSSEQFRTALHATTVRLRLAAHGRRRSRA
jgi:S1-C subfamily serine protease